MAPRLALTLARKDDASFFFVFGVLSNHGLGCAVNTWRYFNVSVYLNVYNMDMDVSVFWSMALHDVTLALSAEETPSG